MYDNHKSPDEMLDRAAEQIRTTEPATEMVDEAGRRVWAQLSRNHVQAASNAAEIAEIRGCDDYQTLIPAYLAGSLPPARTTLLEDHTRECVPCRKALKAARAGEPMRGARSAIPDRRDTSPVVRWALAALLVLGIGAGAFFFWQAQPFGSGTSAVVSALDGELFRIAETSHLPLDAGEPIAEGDRVRTGRGGGAVLALNDGSLVEMRARSELSIDESRNGTTLRLTRGSVIVQAAKQRDRKLYLATEDCLVSVVGTIFSVNHGTKGSRVAVLEGEVHVDHAGEEYVLQPGEQVTTNASLGHVPLASEVEWSRDGDQYIVLLSELAALRRDIIDNAPIPDLRSDSRLLDLMPEGTVFYGAVPNLTETLTESYHIAIARLESSPALSQWWNEHGGPTEIQPRLDDMIARLAEFGAYIGDEVALGAYRDQTGDVDGPVLLAELTDGTGLQTFIEEQLAVLTDGEVPMTFLDDPMSATAGAGEQLYVWAEGDLLVAALDLGDVQNVATLAGGAGNPFVGSDFHGQISALYDEGVGIVLAADLEQVLGEALAEEGSPDDANQLSFTGLDDARHLLVEQKRVADQTEHRAVMTFRNAREGMVSWLAEPAPMGALDFISPDAKAFTAFVIEDPASLLDQLYAQLDGEQGMAAGLSSLRAFEERYGLSLRDDVAASLGGEFAFALDGPMLPTPAWKLVVEVYNPARLQWALEQAILEANTQLAALGQPSIELREEQVGGRTFYTLPAQILDLHYTYDEGYLVAAPSRALLDRALRYQESGYTITDSARFLGRLPSDQRVNFSALFYQDVGSLVQGVMEKLQAGGLTSEQEASVEALREDAEPTLVYAYAEADRLIFAATSDGDLLSNGLLGLLGWAAPGGIGDVIGNLTGNGS